MTEYGWDERGRSLGGVERGWGGGGGESRNPIHAAMRLCGMDGCPAASSRSYSKVRVMNGAPMTGPPVLVVHLVEKLVLAPREGGIGILKGAVEIERELNFDWDWIAAILIVLLVEASVVGFI